jgi:hypothetical protein
MLTILHAFSPILDVILMPLDDRHPSLLLFNAIHKIVSRRILTYSQILEGSGPRSLSDCKAEVSGCNIAHTTQGIPNAC